MTRGIDLISAREIKERLNVEKDPLQYLDEELARSINLLGNRCEKIQDTISIYNNRADKNDQIDMQKIKEELKNLGELYFEINNYLKVRKEQVKNQQRAGQLKIALEKRQKWMEQK
jgi:hypothetical protein